MLVVPAVRAQQPGEAVHLLEREAERLARLAHGAARAVADDGRRHGGAALAVAAVDVLDDLLPAIAGGQVEVDVGPLAALLGEEALEEEAHADRIDRRDAERVADRAVGGRAAPLAEDAALAAEADDVPHDQEIAGEVEPLDHAELVLELPADARRDRPISLACAALGERAQAAARRLAGRERELRKTVAQVRERERAALGDAAALADGVGHVAEET